MRDQGYEPGKRKSAIVELKLEKKKYFAQTHWGIRLMLFLKLWPHAPRSSFSSLSFQAPLSAPLLGVIDFGDGVLHGE